MPGKVFDSTASAVADIGDGATIAVGGFGLCGIPDALIEAIADTEATDLEVFSNNCGVDDHGLALDRSHSTGHGLVRGGEQGIRPAVPGR